ncbi:SRPBCC family protein [Actinocrispum wychmicini]|nr:SRPBCC family protein [Actinocrispum wychmicini]
MGLQRLAARGHSDAEPAAVYALLKAGSTWPTWGTVERFVLERPGSPEPESVGAIRNFHTGRYKMRERVAELVENERFSYELLEGLPLRGYRAIIDLSAANGGTDIHWHTTFRCKVPGMGWVYRRALQKITSDMVAGLVRHTAANKQRPTSR